MCPGPYSLGMGYQDSRSLSSTSSWLVGILQGTTLSGITNWLPAMRAKSWPLAGAAAPKGLSALSAGDEVATRKKNNLPVAGEANNTFTSLWRRRCWCRGMEMEPSQELRQGLLHCRRRRSLVRGFADAVGDDLPQPLSRVIGKVGLVSREGNGMSGEIASQAAEQERLNNLCLVRGRQTCEQLEANHPQREDVGCGGVRTHLQDLRGLVGESASTSECCPPRICPIGEAKVRQASMKSSIHQDVRTLHIAVDMRRLVWSVRVEK